MVKLRRRSSPAAPGRGLVGLSAPTPSNPVEVGLLLRAAREREGSTLEQVRDATGVPRVDLDALEHGRLELLHVEQAAVVGLWRYGELVGLDPAVLVPVLRSHWPRPALAVDAFHGELGGVGTPCARLARAEGILSRIAPKTRELAAASAPLGLSAATREQLARGAAGAVLTVALIGPARRAAGSRRRPGIDARSAPPRALEAASSTMALPTEDPAAVVASTAPAPAPAPARAAGDAARHEPVGDDPVGREPAGHEQSEHSRRWPHQIAHTVAERFGLDDEPHADATAPDGALPTDPARRAGSGDPTPDAGNSRGTQR
ncbi:MAG TPA: helix-turn-helix domain-containing protein [Acidimicrobiales bacterium]|nr:helix-turn-helix domain-containing protein [Acidimicrobiales bacterium]